MRAMIMAAGVGTRLQPLTLTVPKPMVPITNVPAIHHILRLLARHGIREAVLNLHYHGDQIHHSLQDGAAFGMSVQYSWEKDLLGTAGGVKRVESFLGNDTFLIISGDALTDIDLTNFLAFHRQQQALASIAMKQVQDTSKLGVVVTDPNTSQIRSFQEKPKPEEALSNWANTGIYLFEPSIFACIPPETFYDFGSQLFPLLAAETAPFYGYKMKGYWCDIGSLLQYRLSHYDVLNGAVQIEVPGAPTGWGWQGRNSAVHRTVKLAGRHLIGDSSVLGERVVLMGNCTIGNNCRIDAGAVLNDVVVWDNTHIGPNVLLDQCVVGSDCSLAAESQVGEGAVLSDEVVLEWGSSVAPFVCLWPGIVAEQRARLTVDQKS